METQVYRRGSDEEEESCSCEGKGWVLYTAELLDGTTEEAFELCSCARYAVAEQIAAEERRVLKAYRKFKVMGDEILATYRRGKFYFQSESRPGLFHQTSVTKGGKGFCSCEDKQINEVEECWHIICARLVRAESAPCAGCNNRFHRSKLAEVQAAGDGMMFWPAQLICPSCLAGSGCEVA